MAGWEGRAVAVISGYHVDEYCVQAFTEAVRMLQERFGAQKVTDFATIAPGDLIARVPPKIVSDEKSGSRRQVPVYRIQAVGDDFDENGDLTRTAQSDYLYFQADRCYLLDPSAQEPLLEVSDEYQAGVVDCFESRDVGRVKETHAGLDEDLKGILYRLPLSLAEAAEPPHAESAGAVASEEP